MDRRVLSGRGLSAGPHGNLPTRQIVKRLVVVVFALGLLFAGTTIRAMAGPGPGPTVERDMENSPYVYGGEPEIAVDPTNPANIVYVENALRYYRVEEGGQYVEVPGGAVVESKDRDLINCFLFYTNDGGKHWHQAAWPFSGTPTPNCTDPMVAVDKYGTFYAAGDQDSDVAVVYSTDGGADWSQSVVTGTVEDRPFFRVDHSSGKLYLQSGTSPRQMVYATGVPHDCQQYDVRAACQLTWSTPVAWPGNHSAVSNGILAAAVQQSAYPATLDPTVGPAGTTQLTFEYSKDDWKDVTTEAVTDSNGNPVTGGSDDYVSADPNTPNRFAVMQQSGNDYQIYVTNDNGQHWRGPTVVNPGSAPTKPWIDYSVDEPGVLGLVYKTTDTQGDMDVWSLVSLNNGVSFSNPLQLNPKTATAPPGAAQLFGIFDDLSWVLIANNTLYGGYGQMTPCTVYGTASSCMHSFLATSPLKAYGALGANG
jgi:hypothetical protein